ncbi:hypothetical protein D3C81_1702320 [compost metagenome]
MSARATLVTISFKPDTSTASNTPTRPMMIRGPKTCGAAAVGLAAARGAVTVREVITASSGILVSEHFRKVGT